MGTTYRRSPSSTGTQVRRAHGRRTCPSACCQAVPRPPVAGRRSQLRSCRRPLAARPIETIPWSRGARAQAAGGHPGVWPARGAGCAGRRVPVGLPLLTPGPTGGAAAGVGALLRGAPPSPSTAADVASLMGRLPASDLLAAKCRACLALAVSFSEPWKELRTPGPGTAPRVAPGRSALRHGSSTPPPPGPAAAQDPAGAAGPAPALRPARRSEDGRAAGRLYL